MTCTVYLKEGGKLTWYTVFSHFFFEKADVTTCREVLDGREGGAELPLKLQGMDLPTLHACPTGSSLCVWLLEETLEVLFWAEKGMELWDKYSVCLVINGWGVPDRLSESSSVYPGVEGLRNSWKSIFTVGLISHQTH